MLTGNPTGKRPLGRPGCRWEDNMTMDFKETGVNARNWIGSGLGYRKALVNVALDLRVS